MLSIITPCYRQELIPFIYDCIMFDKIHKWIIVYDTSNNRTYEKIYKEHPKILEVECSDPGTWGNAQRNYGMSLVEDGFIYFLDDDNIIHPNFWNIIEILHNDYFFTFDQMRDYHNKIFYGNRIEVKFIDTAMFIIHKQHIQDIKWRTDEYGADGFFICDILNRNPNSHIYINIIGCYYNFIVEFFKYNSI